MSARESEPQRDLDNRYRPATKDPRELRSRSANRSAAIALIAALVVIIVIVALFN